MIFRDLTSLESLSLDRNFITEIDGDDLNYLSQSPSLSSLSFVSNKIAKIGNRAFEHLHALSILSLQNNEYSGRAQCFRSTLSLPVEYTFSLPYR